MSAAPQISPLRDMDEAAAYLRMHRTTLSKRVSAGDLSYVTIGDNPAAKNAVKYFLQEELDRFIQARTRRVEARAITARRAKKANSTSPW